MEEVPISEKWPSFHLSRIRHRLIRLLEAAPRIFVKDFPGRRQSDFVVQPLEKSHTDFLFESLRLPAAGVERSLYDSVLMTFVHFKCLLSFANGQPMSNEL